MPGVVVSDMSATMVQTLRPNDTWGRGLVAMVGWSFLGVLYLVVTFSNIQLLFSIVFMSFKKVPFEVCNHCNGINAT